MMKYGLFFKIRFWWQQGFWPQEHHIRSIQKFDEVLEQLKQNASQKKV